VSSTAVLSTPAKAGKSPRPCCTPGCKNLVNPPYRKCTACRRRARSAARARTRGRGFGWGAARVLSASVLSASDAISVNADFYHDRQSDNSPDPRLTQTEEQAALEEVAAARHQERRGPNGECPFCGLIHCYCASPSEIRRATMVEVDRDD